jgi:hypothetical protein
MNNLAEDIAELFLDAQDLIVYNIREGWGRQYSQDERELAVSREKYRSDASHREKRKNNARKWIKNNRERHNENRRRKYSCSTA